MLPWFRFTAALLFLCACTSFTLAYEVVPPALNTSTVGSTTRNSITPQQYQLNQLVVALIVNHQANGEYFVYVDENNHFFFKEEDLRKISQAKSSWQTIEYQKEILVPLTTIEGLKIKFDEKTLELHLDFKPDQLEGTRIDLGSKRRENVLHPLGTSLFLNYRASRSGSDSGTSSNQFATEIGLRMDRWLLESDFIAADTQNRGRPLRLMSSLTLDRRDELQRLTIGDLNAYSGELGSAVTLGGIGLTKSYSMDPYLIRQPLAGFSGTVSTPSQADIYVDGVKVRTATLNPGQFNIDQLNYYGGVRNVEVVIKDAFGRQEVLSYRHYFTNSLLKAGLEEYSYNLGVLRQNLGLVNNDYGPLIASASHRLGISDALTLGFRLEASKQRSNYGLESTFSVGTLGTVGLQVSQSSDQESGMGNAGLFRYNYQERGFNFRFSKLQLSNDYLPVWISSTLDRTRSQRLAGVGYGSLKTGTIDLSTSSTQTFNGVDNNAISLGYSKNLDRNLVFFANLTRITGTEPDKQLTIGINWYPEQNFSGNFSHTSKNGSQREQVQLAKNPPIGEGWGYRLQMERQQGESIRTDSISPYVQYNGEHGTYSAQYFSERSNDGTRSSNHEFAVAGAIAYVDGNIGFTRPIYDAFAIVDLDGVPNVRVYQNNQLAGRTQADGRLFIPNLGAYAENEISVQDSDVPIDFSLAQKTIYISPLARSGSSVKFRAPRQQAVTGKLVFDDNGQISPAEYFALKIESQGQTLTTPTGQGGEFYFENLSPGQYSGQLKKNTRYCTYNFVIPANKQVLLELGEIRCAF